MWFKQCKVYTFTQEIELPNNVEDLLADKAFRPCQQGEEKTLGWVQPIRNSGLYALQQAQALLLCLRKEEKVIPASAIKAEIEQAEQAFQDEHARAMPRKDIKALKEDIQHKLLPRALSKFTVTWGYLDLAKQRVVIQTTSAARAEEFTATLRECLGSLPVRPWAVHDHLQVVFSQWLKTSRIPEPLQLGFDLTLKSVQEKGSQIKVKQVDLTYPEVIQHLESHPHIGEIGLTMDDLGSFILTDDLTIKSLVFDDVIQEQREEQDDDASQLDADFILLYNALDTLLDTLEQKLALEENHES